MTSAAFGYCTAHGMVPTKYDVSFGAIILAIILIFLFGIGLLILIAYILYVVLVRDRVCSICGSQVYPMPMPMPVYQPYPQPYYYPYPPQPPYYPPQR